MPANKLLHMENLDKKISTELSLGHLLVLWDILSNKVTGDELRKKFSEEELRAIWSFQDKCEQELTSIGITAKPETEWNELMQNALVHTKKLPVEFLDK